MMTCLGSEGLNKTSNIYIYKTGKWWERDCDWPLKAPAVQVFILTLAGQGLLANCYKNITQNTFYKHHKTSQYMLTMY